MILRQESWDCLVCSTNKHFGVKATDSVIFYEENATSEGPMLINLGASVTTCLGDEANER